MKKYLFLFFLKTFNQKYAYLIHYFRIWNNKNIIWNTKKYSGFFPIVYMNNLYIPASQLLSLSCISMMCSQGKQTDRPIDRHTVKKKNRRMSATTSDAMLRTHFVCYLYSFSLYRSSSSTMMMMGIPRCKRMAGGWYSTFGTHTREAADMCIYVCVLPCSDDDATEMKRVLRRGGTLQWDVREEREKT